MLSVIIPTFNRQASTSQAIKSILSQDVQTEIIVIDDASDEPFGIQDNELDHSNIKVIRKDKNQGPASARNLGIEIATQPLISFLDSDDYLMENTLKQRVDHAVANGILEKDGAHKIIGCSWQETNSAGSHIKTRHPKPAASSDDLFTGCWFCPGSAIIMNRDLFKQSDILFDEDLKRLEDLDLFMRLGQKGATYEAHHIIGVSIAASDSRYPNVIIDACEAISKKFLNSQSSLDQKLKARLKSYLFYELSRAHISKHEYHKAMDYLIKSFLQRPRLSLYPGPGWTSSPTQD